MLGKAQRESLLREVMRLRDRVAELEAETARTLRLDTVTGLLDPRAFRGRLSEEVERARRYQRDLCVTVISIDDFCAIALPTGSGPAMTDAVRGLAVRSGRDRGSDRTPVRPRPARSQHTTSTMNRVDPPALTRPP